MYQEKGTLPSVAAHGERRAVATTTAFDYIPKPLRTATAYAAAALVGYAAIRAITWAMYYAAAFFNPSLPWA